MQSQVERQSNPPPEHYTVAIICSLGVQLKAIKRMFDTHFQTPHIDQTYDHNAYTCGCINGHNVVVASKGLGQTGVVNASAQIGPLIQSFVQLQCTIVLGTAGGTPHDPPKSDPMEDIRLGDVVVGWPGPGLPSLVQWDSGIHELDGIKIISLFDKPAEQLLGALTKLQDNRSSLGDAKFRENLERCIADESSNFSQPEPESDKLFIPAYDHPSKDTSCKSCSSSKLVKRSERTDATEVKIHYGTIASGSSVVKSAKLRDEVRDKTGALCIEISAAGVAAVDRVKPLVIKGISDYADSHKTNDMAQWRSYAAATTAAYVRELLYTMDPGLLPGMNYNQPHLSNSETQDCLRDLQSTDPCRDKKRIEDIKGGLLPDLYRWILKDDNFKKWRDNKESRLLWIMGDPGKGKTMLLCGIIDELEKNSSRTRLVSYFFCQATDSRINTTTAILRDLIYLLVDRQRSLISYVRKRYNQVGKTLFQDVNAWVALSEILTDIL